MPDTDRRTRGDHDGGVGRAPEDRADQAVRVAARWLAASRRLDMQGLAHELGVSRVTLFRAIGSREDLLGRTLWWQTDRTLRTCLARCEAQRRPGELLSIGTGRLFNALVARSTALRRLLDEEPAVTIRVLTDPSGPVQPRVVAFVEGLLRRDIAEFGLELTIDPSSLAFAIVRLGESFVYADVLANRPVDVATADRLQQALILGSRR